MDLKIKYENGICVVEYPADPTFEILYCQAIFDKVISVNDIVKIVSNIPKHFRSIHLWEGCGEKTSTKDCFDKLIRSLAYLPKHIKSIDFGCMHLDRFAASELAKIFSVIPTTVTSINLGNNRLFCSFTLLKCNAHEVHDRVKTLKAALYKFPKHVYYLCLAKNTLEASYMDGIKDFFPAIPNTVTELDISNNSFLQPGSKNAKSFFSTLPKSIVSIIWKENKPERSWEYSSCPTLWDNNVLADTLSSLPATVLSLDLSDNGLWKKQGLELGAIFSKLSKELKLLKLGNNRLYLHTNTELTNMFLNLPQGIESLDLSENEFGRKSITYLNAIFGNLPPNIRTLNLSKNDFFHKNGADLAAFFSVFNGMKLASINLSQNKLWIISARDLSQGFSSLSSNITELNLSENDLGEKSKTDLIMFLSTLPRTLSTLDLSHNRLLLLNSEELAEVFLNLAPGIKCLKLRKTFFCSRTSNYLGLALSGIPQTISSLDLGENNLFMIKEDVLAAAFSMLPATVESLDLSGNRLHLKASSELKKVFSKLPAYLKELKLCNNGLNVLSLVELKEMFSGIGASVSILDLSENGLENLPQNEFNKLMNAIPDTVSRVRLCKTMIRNDGKLVSKMPGNYPKTLFKQTKGTLVYQARFAELRLPMMQWICTQKICSDVVCIIMSFLLNESPLLSLRMNKKLNETILPIMIQRRLSKESAQQESIQAVQSRMHELSEGAELLDLSRCGLNRVYNFKLLKTILEEIPKTVNTIKLRGNGFTQDNGKVFAIKGVLGTIPPWISCLDLSDNQLERLNSNQLQALFINLPKTITLVTLNTTKPIHPVNLIAQKQWPLYYTSLIQNRASSMEKSSVILSNYVNKQFDFCFFMRGKGCMPPYIEEVKIILQRIQNGEIQHVAELIEAIEQIDAPEQNRSLMKRLRFIENIESMAESSSASLAI